MVYFIILFFLLFCVYKFDYAKQRNFYALCYWGTMVVLIVMAGLRYRIGIDSVMYENSYATWPTFSKLFTYNFDSTRFDPGFMILASIPRSISDDFMLFQFFQSAIVNGVIFWFIYRNTQNRFFCLTLYFFVNYVFFNTEILRESLAVCCFLLAWPAFKKDNWLVYYLWAFLAFLIHSSALITLLVPIFWLPGIRSFFQFGYRSLIVGVLVFLLGIFIQLKFNTLISVVSLTEKMTEKATLYADSKEYGHGLNIMGMIDTFVRFVAYSLLALWLYKSRNRRLNRDNKEQKEAQKMEFMVVWLVYLALIGMSMVILLRFTNYFILFGFVLLSKVFLGKIYLRDKIVKLRPLYWSIILIPFFFFNFYYYVRPVNNAGNLHVYNKYIPYNSRIELKRDPTREAIFRFYGAR